METTGPFPPTVWTEILAISRTDPVRAREAFGHVYDVYRKPLFLYARRRSFDGDQAHDLVQAFFEKVLQKDYLGSADPAKGKFRWFLLTAFKRFLANTYDHAQALKRGGGKKFVPLDTDIADSYPAGHEEVLPDLHYDIACAHALLGKVIQQMERDYADRGKTREFEAFRGQLPGQKSERSHAELGAALGKSDEAVRKQAERFRRRFGQLFLAEMRSIAPDPRDAAEEFGYLVSLLARFDSP